MQNFNQIKKLELTCLQSLRKDVMEHNINPIIVADDDFMNCIEMDDEALYDKTCTVTLPNPKQEEVIIYAGFVVMYNKMKSVADASQIKYAYLNHITKNHVYATIVFLLKRCPVIMQNAFCGKPIDEELKILSGIEKHFIECGDKFDFICNMTWLGISIIDILRLSGTQTSLQILYNSYLKKVQFETRLMLGRINLSRLPNQNLIYTLIYKDIVNSSMVHNFSYLINAEQNVKNLQNDNGLLSDCDKKCLFFKNLIHDVAKHFFRNDTND